MIIKHINLSVIHFLWEKQHPGAWRERQPIRKKKGAEKEAQEYNFQLL